MVYESISLFGMEQRKGTRKSGVQFWGRIKCFVNKTKMDEVTIKNIIKYIVLFGSEHEPERTSD